MAATDNCNKGGKTVRKIAADELTALGGPAPYSLVGVDDAYDWSGNTKGARIGTFYTILRMIDVEKVRVLVREPTPIIDPATLENMSLTQFPKVMFDHVTATISANSKTGALSIYAEAAAIKLVTPQK